MADAVMILQLQQVVDSFIIFSAQQTVTNTANGHIELPSSNSSSSFLKVPWTQMSPSKIRIAPFPTREYTDDEFQTIVKNVMGVLYVFLFSSIVSLLSCTSVYFCNNYFWWPLSRYLLGFLYPISRLISYLVFEKVW